MEKTMILALTSSKGGVGKSTLAVGLSGVLAMRGPTALMDADVEIGTSRDWALRAKLPVQVVGEEEGVPQGTRYMVLDTEGRPDLEAMLALTRGASTVLIPTAPNGVELRATLALWHKLNEAGGDMHRVRVIITKAPPVGTVGQQARDDLRARGIQVCETVVRLYAAHQRAYEQGVLVRDVHDARSENAWADLLSLTVEVC
ncbi:ParA family protein [Deinococcus alpinitundrae]|uniref:ParA family protein n=1 Tax=Deinococcus alpinitundrae TaxID=468913 RepID=UPI00137A0DB3|nr:ParA family protein [Deinococcus alpinitundrae]